MTEPEKRRTRYTSRRRQPTYESTEHCLSCGATPTNAQTGLCRYCDAGGDDDE